jgi:DMSO/TMAO reductase YedYZ molybdopterin-dependent catalytic subunit
MNSHDTPPNVPSPLLSSTPRMTTTDAAINADGDEAVLREAARRSRRSFIVGGLAALAGLGGWRWLATRPTEDGIPWTLRKVLDANGELSASYFSNARLAPVFSKHQARMPRTNGNIGVGNEFDIAAWKLNVQGYAPNGPSRNEQFTLADIKALPRVELTTELKCIEGWSTIVTWAGARFADFIARYPLASHSIQATSGKMNPNDLAPYVSLATPDERYYVGLDMATALHPQTLLCYEMNGQPLTLAHGAPLRLVTPLKYGIKYIKRIGVISFIDKRPNDYWAQQGYDWDSGH